MLGIEQSVRNGKTLQFKCGIMVAHLKETAKVFMHTRDLMDRGKSLSHCYVTLNSKVQHWCSS